MPMEINPEVEITVDLCTAFTISRSIAACAGYCVRKIKTECNEKENPKIRLEKTARGGYSGYSYIVHQAFHYAEYMETNKDLEFTYDIGLLHVSLLR